MKNFLTENRIFILFSLILIVVWRSFLILPDYLGKYIPRYPGFLGPISWANMDGLHYLYIGSRGYVLGERAFFPLFPVLIQFFRLHFPFFPRTTWALIIVYFALFFALVFLGKLIAIDYPKKTVFWSLVFLLFFPAGFFFGSVYTESLFLALVVISFYLARKKKFLFASIIAGIASVTRLVGIFLLPALLIEYFFSLRNKSKKKVSVVLHALGIALFSSSGLLGYMYFCWKTAGDPLRFVHVQSIFGANRSSDKIILLPQVLFRYSKILFTIPYTNHDFLVALLELFSFLLFAFILLLYWKRIRLSYLVFSGLAILLPTLTGTLSSMPRYVLAAFPVFIVLGNIKNTKIKVLLLIIFAAILVATTSFFIRGYFIA